MLEMHRLRRSEVASQELGGAMGYWLTDVVIGVALITTRCRGYSGHDSGRQPRKLGSFSLSGLDPLCCAVETSNRLISNEQVGSVCPRL